MRLLQVFYFLATTLLAASASAQVVTIDPPYPTKTDSVTVIFDASQGDMGLVGVNQVYAHTGLLTSMSLNEADWQYKPSAWPADGVTTADSLIEMENIGNQQHRIKFKMDHFYGFNTLVDVRAMMFVFRNQDGTLVGKNADGSDIKVPVYDDGFSAFFSDPITQLSDIALNSTFPVEVISNQNAQINIFHEGNLVAQNFGTSASVTLPATQTGKFWLRYTAQSGGDVIEDSTFYIVRPANTVSAVPAGTPVGISYPNDTTVRFMVHVPGKDHCYIRADWNDWEIHPDNLMNQTPDGNYFWTEITGLTADSDYRFQYLIDSDIRVADPWSEVVLQQYTDVEISFFTYPNLPDYPDEHTIGSVGVVRPGEAEFTWTDAGFQKPNETDLVIYELMVRDFGLRHDFGFVVDSLDYLERLGINAIELMPVNEYDGNNGWGYNPAFYAAVDKWYGPRVTLKELVNECHARGIAVIVDKVFNHAFDLNPNVLMYYNRGTQSVSADNPWFNEQCPHEPYCWGEDFNHFSTTTRDYFKQVLNYWVDEYHVDGFRFDVSGGFSNNGIWGPWDQDRINILKEYKDALWANHWGTYMILEHWQGNDEERELANYGFMIWSNANHNFRQAGMGWNDNGASNWEWLTSANARGFNNQHLVSYSESHDEERMMYENLEYGKIEISNGDTLYNTRDLSTALDRMGGLAAFLLAVPGPKMLWQFQELGYDISINFNGRTGPKPVRWVYRQDPDRYLLFKKFAALIDLRISHPVFESTNYGMDVALGGKRFWITNGTTSVTLAGNFDTYGYDMQPSWQHTGTWYDYMTGEAHQVNNTSDTWYFEPGEWHLWIDEQLPTPDLDVSDLYPDTTSSTNELPVPGFGSHVFPNPFSDELTLSFYLEAGANVNVSIYNILGERVATLHDGQLPMGRQQLRWNGIDASGNAAESGYYLYRIVANGQSDQGRLLLVR